MAQIAVGGCRLAVFPVDVDLLQAVWSIAACAGLPPILEGAWLSAFEHAHEPFTCFRPFPEMDLVVAIFVGYILGGPALVVAGLHSHVWLAKAILPDHIAPHPGKLTVAPGL